MVRDEDGSWVVADAALACPFGHVVGMRGRLEGEPSRVTGVGDCVTIVFFDRASRTAMLTTPSESPNAVADTRIATPAPKRTG